MTSAEPLATGSKARVVVVVENLPVPFDRRVWMEATTLAQAGYQVSVICPKGKGYEGEDETIERVRVLRHDLPAEGASPRGYLKEYSAAIRAERRLLRVLEDERPIDVIHLCNPPDLLFLAALPYKLMHGTRIVFDQHDINPELYQAKYGRRDLFEWGLRVAERLTFASANVVISTNESYRDIALTRGRKRAEDVFIVRSAPDLSRFGPVPAHPEYRGRWRTLVGYVGVMGEQEGLDLLLDAIDHIVHEMGRHDIGFMLIGGGTALEPARASARRLDLEDSVQFTGRVPDDELIARLSSCDLCVNPDRVNAFNSASTMNKVLEYMALAKPVVQFDLLEGRRSAKDASLYAAANDPVDLAHKIVELADDPAMAETMGRLGRERMEAELEWRHQRPRLLEAYERVMVR